MPLDLIVMLRRHPHALFCLWPTASYSLSYEVYIRTLLLCISTINEDRRVEVNVNPLLHSLSVVGREM